jgi:uncharacterized sulfatase
MPHKLNSQHVSYMFQTPTTQVWQRLHDEGKLTPAQDLFWQPKPPEELYDLATDPDEVRNLVDSPEHRDIHARLRQAQQDLAGRIRDVGFLPEGEIHSRSTGTTPYDMGHDPLRYPFAAIFAAAERASSRDTSASQLVELLGADDSAVRYWGALGLLIHGADTVRAGQQQLITALADPSPYVRVAAAEALGRYGSEEQVQRAKAELVKLADWREQNVFVAVAALNGLGALGQPSAALREQLSRLPQTGPAPHARYADYVSRLLRDL